MKSKKIVIAGGSGFIGQYLAQYFSTANQVVILSRQLPVVQNNAYGFQQMQANKNILWVKWSGVDGGEWEQVIEGADLLINLAGKSVNCRYTEANKQAIFDSRTLSTIALGQAVAKAVHPPKVWINASSATIYRHATDRPQNELNGDIENDFSVQVCKHWEQAFFDAPGTTTRKIALRMAITLGKGGVMVPYCNLVKWGLGGKHGSGKQMFSWVHIYDVCRAVEFIFTNTQMQGVYNVSSPNPVTNATFMQQVRNTLGVPFGLPATKGMLALGAWALGTETELLLKSRWVVPTRLQQAGFTFAYTTVPLALQNIMQGGQKKVL